MYRPFVITYSINCVMHTIRVLRKYLRRNKGTVWFHIVNKSFKKKFILLFCIIETSSQSSSGWMWEIWLKSEGNVKTSKKKFIYYYFTFNSPLPPFILYIFCKTLIALSSSWMDSKNFGLSGRKNIESPAKKPGKPHTITNNRHGL